jgi:hypothetical protein
LRGPLVQEYGERNPSGTEQTVIGKTRLFAILSVFGSLVIVAAPTSTEAAERAGQRESARDAKLVCHRVQKPESDARERACMTRAQRRAARDAQVVCRWGKPPGSDVREEFCATVAQWRAYDARAIAFAGAGAGAGFAGGTSPSAPGSTNFGGTVASQSSFQR